MGLKHGLQLQICKGGLFTFYVFYSHCENNLPLMASAAFFLLLIQSFTANGNLINGLMSVSVPLNSAVLRG